MTSMWNNPTEREFCQAAQEFLQYAEFAMMQALRLDAQGQLTLISATSVKDGTSHRGRKV